MKVRIKNKTETDCYSDNLNKNWKPSTQILPEDAIKTVLGKSTTLAQ